MGIKKILSADIGGTNSRFAHFDADQNGNLILKEVEWLKTAESGSFKQLIAKLRSGRFALKPEEADIFVIAIAGPIEDGLRSSPALISWDIDLSSAEQDFGFDKFALVNDFVSQAYACISPAGESAEQILPGIAVPGAAIGVIGAGTGLGQAALTVDSRGRYIAVPSEGGHANFPFVSKEEYEFQEFLLKERGERYITGNSVVSGRGLSYIHLFLTGEKLGPAEVADKFPEHPRTLEWASRFYGRACRNYALEILSVGGLYIAGGVAGKEPVLVKHTAFETEFRSSDTMGALLEKMPVRLITDPDSGLWGGAVYGLQKMKDDF